MMAPERNSELLNELRAYADPEYRYSLDPAFYTSPAWLDYETENLLHREWLCLGREQELADPGDYFTVELLGEPLLVIRGNDNQIRVLSNVCRHRNMQLLAGTGNSKRLVCPYHAWTYQSDGQLLRAPYMEDRIEKSCHGLPEFKTDTWQGFIFVNLDGNADSLQARLSELDNILENYHSDEMHHVFVAEEVWAANWKCLLENFMEGYHLSRVHPQTLGGRTPTKLCEKFPGGAAYTGYRAHYPETAPFRGKCHPDLTPQEKNCSTLFSVFPAMVASQASDVLVYLSLQPNGVDQVKIRWGMAVYDAEMVEDEIQARVELWQAINAEDKAKLAKVQQALYSKSAVSGPLAPGDYEGTIRDFYGYLLRRLSVVCPPGTAPSKSFR